MTTFTRKLVLVMMVAFVPLVPSTQLFAGTVFDSFGPGDTYNTFTYFNVFGPASGAGSYLSQADQFSPSSTGQLSSVSIAVKVDEGTPSVAVSITLDNGGLPGAVLESFIISGLTSSSTIVSANSVLHPTLTAGQLYWFVYGPGASDSANSINFNSIGAKSNRASSTDGGASFNNGGYGEIAAFRVSVLPEPSSFALLGLGALGIVFATRRQTSQK